MILLRMLSQVQASPGDSLFMSWIGFGIGNAVLWGELIWNG